LPRARKKLRVGTRLKIKQVVRMSAGFHKTPEEIAMLLGGTVGEITDLMNHPDYRVLEDEYTKEMYGPVDAMVQQQNAGRMLEDASPDAAEALIALLYDMDPSERRRAATAVLDRSGHGPIQRKVVANRIQLDPVLAKMMSEAMRESAVEEIEAEVVTDD